MEKVEVEEKVYNRIKEQVNHNMLSHAYLLEADGYSEIEGLIRKIVKTLLCPLHGEHDSNTLCEQCRLIDMDQCADLQMIYPQGNNIKKEQLLEVKKLFKTTSSSHYRVYVLYEAEKLNPASANTILKFLEEPEAGIIAFLVARNRYQVLDTLVSRCQILTLHNDSKIDFNSSAMEFFRKVVSNTDFYMDFKDILSIYMPEKEKAREILEEIELCCHQLLLDQINESSSFSSEDPLSKLSKNSIIKYISIIEEEKPKLVYNVNYRLWLDHFLVRLLEVLM